VPPEVTLDNYRMILGSSRFHAEGQAARSSCPCGTAWCRPRLTGVNLVVGKTAGYAYARLWRSR